MDYMEKCGAARKEMQEMLNDLNGRHHKRGNLQYLVKLAIRGIESVENYMGHFGTDEMDDQIAHVGYTREQMGYDK